MTSVQESLSYDQFHTDCLTEQTRRKMTVRNIDLGDIEAEPGNRHGADRRDTACRSGYLSAQYNSGGRGIRLLVALLINDHPRSGRPLTHHLD